MENPFGINKKSFQSILETLERFPAVEEAVLFGSRAKGTFKPGSDIDIAIKGRNVSDEVALNISSILNEEKPIPYSIDVISHYSIKNKELKDHIDRVGISFYQKQ